MGRMISEEEFITGSVFQYEDRMNSQYSRFLDRTPTYVTYYNISNNSSTVDNGFQNVEEFVGSNSPIRFNKVDNFPIYGIEQIALELTDEEEGLNISFDSDAIILPNTIEPRPGDFFVINHLKINVQFMVTEIKYDTIKSNNFYKVSYTLKNLSSVEELESQVDETFKCIATNIGTEDKCIIKEEDFYKLTQLEEYISQLIARYKLFFYSEKYNMFVIPHENGLLHDPYLSLFLHRNNVFNSRTDYNTIIPTIVADERTLEIFYELSMFRSIEKCQKPKITTYNIITDNDQCSPMSYYGTHGYITTFPGSREYLPEEFFTNIESAVVDTGVYCNDLISMYLNELITSINQIDLEKLKSHMLIIPNYTNMITNGILLFVLQQCYKRFIKIKN